jgi:pimeloyl-ACP methyl ester carboxylesterase
MHIYSQVQDLHRYLNENGINEKVTLVGHSLGAKVAMAYSLLHPERVEGLCSIDSPPVDRNEFPEMNQKTLKLVESVVDLLPSIESKTYKEAWAWLKSMLKTDNKIIITSLMMNLDKSSLEKARLLVNVQTLAQQRSLSEIMGFPLFQDHSISDLASNKLLFINGANSM